MRILSRDLVCRQAVALVEQEPERRPGDQTVAPAERRGRLHEASEMA